MANPSNSAVQNLLPVQAYFDLQGNFLTFIGQGVPFYATFNPVQSGLTITNSTINSSIIGGTTPAAGYFTNIATNTGTIATSPSANTDITNKLYVDTVTQGLGPKAACQVGTTINITLSGLQTIDGYTTVAGDRVLVKNQSASQFNGIYIASATTWTRAVDMDVWAEVPGAYTIILNGSQAGTGWVCTATKVGTIDVTTMPWVQFSVLNTYYAGTGLTLASNTFSITPVGTAGTYGSASSVPVLVTNASGQITGVTNTTIGIANTQVSGLGTMSTQNANNVAITGGTITGTPISGSTVGGSTITASSQFSGPGTGLTGTATSLSIGGNAATATSATSAGSVTNSVTFNNAGAGGASGSTFNGGSALTVSYNTIGAPSITGANASGTWGISITGNAATVTNGVYTTGSYSNPTWITSISGSIVSGAVASATAATNLSGGLAGSLPYQSALNTTTFLGIGSANYVLTSSGTAPQYVAQSTLAVGSATTATTATNLAGGAASQIPYQTGSGATSFIANGTTGQFLTSNGSSAPSWTTSSASVTISDQTSSASTFYPTFVSTTSGSASSINTSSTKLQYVPSTGTFSSTVFSGSGASLTSIPNAALVNSSVTIGSTGVALGATVTTFAGLTSVTSTTFVGALTGNASSATTATTATNATNIAITDNTSSVATWYPTIVSTTTGNLPATTSSTKLSFVPSTGVLSATSFTGAGTGLTGTASSLSIGGNAATATSATSATSATTATNIAGGANLQIPYQTGAGATSFVAAPTLSSTYLSYNGTSLVWAASAGVGTVTSVGLSLPSIFTVSGSPVTTTGTLTGTLATQTAATVFAGPATGAAATPTFRALVATDVPTLNQSTTGSAATLTTPRAIYGNNFDGSAALTQIIASTYGGTGNGFTKFSGATTAEKTYTLPDSNATLLYSGGALGTPSSGTVTNLTGTASININGTVGATTASTGAFTTVSATGVITSTIATGTAPFTVTSTTAVANLSIGGNAATATSATTATNVAGGTVGAIHYQSAAGATAFLTGNTTTTPQFVTSTGTGTVAQAPTLTSSTGSGSVVLATSPTLVTPALGTPASGVLTNATGLPLSTGVTGTLPAANGGTAQSTYATGDTIYASAVNTLSKLTIGTTGQVLTVAGGVPTWATSSGGGATITGTTTTGTYYVVGTTLTSGSLSTASISNTNVVSYNANTGALSAVSMVSSSDERLKTDWEDLPVDFVKNLANVKHGNFTRIANGNKEVGVSAQSLQSVLPRSVLANDEGMLSVNYGSAALVAAIELAKQVMELKQEIALLKGNK